MRVVLVIFFFTICSFGAAAQWRWYLQAEVGANKQEFQQAYALTQQPFDPESFWKGTAGGELQFGYTFLKGIYIINNFIIRFIIFNLRCIYNLI